MDKNKEYTNILKKNKIREIIKERGLKVNNESLDKFNEVVSSFLLKVINNIDYDLKISGRKSIKKDDVKGGLNKLIKGDEYFEI